MRNALAHVLATCCRPVATPLVQVGRADGRQARATADAETDDLAPAPVVAATAIIAATETMRPPSRTLSDIRYPDGGGYIPPAGSGW
jgi:hypothetical protein